MKGRVLYKIYSPILIFTSMIFKILPMFVVAFFWDVIKPFNGYVFYFIRYSILKAKTKSIGKNILIGSNVVIRNMKKLELGTNVSIHDFSVIYCDGGLRIGDNVSIAHRCSIITTNHSFENKMIPIKYNPVTSIGVEIKNDVWLGADVKILDGVIVNKRTIVAAGGVVNKTFKGGVVLGGIPCRIIKKID